MSDSQRHLCFNLGARQFAIPLLSAKEVIGLPEITPIPQSPPHFLGIMNLRGNVISVMDLRVKLGIKVASTSETTIIILDLGTYDLGIVVDSINSVQSIDQSQLSPPPVVESKNKTNYISGVYKKDDGLTLILDISKALSVEDHAVLKQKAPAAAA